MKTAVFLGAGASKTFGYPLTSELLPRLLQRLDEELLFDGTNSHTENADDRKWFASRLFKFLPGLKESWRAAKSRAVTDSKDPWLQVSITDLLSLVDRALGHTESRAGMPPEELQRFRHLLDRGIYEALVRGNGPRTLEEGDFLHRFVEWLKELPLRSGVITTNYDGLIDRRLFESMEKGFHQASRVIGEKVDFGFPWRAVDDGELIPRPINPVFNLYKLHGSISWLKCSLCGQIYLNTGGAIGTKAFKRKLDDWNTCDCNRWSRLRLHLVTPSLVRQMQDPQLLGIAQAALEFLRTANQWVIIGYSFPSEDVAIRSMFLRAWDGRTKKPQITVIQRGSSAVEEAYRSFFPKSVLSYHNDGLGAFIDRVSPKRRAVK